jgi:sortase A
MIKRKGKSPEDLSVEELRRLLLEKRRQARRERLEQFRRSGRALDVPLPENRLPEQASHAEAAPPASTAPAPRRKWSDRVLAAVEVVALLGFLFVVFNVFNVLNDLNAEALQLNILPTLTPTPLVTAVVLPSGHTPPDAFGVSRPNDAEIPEHLRPAMQAAASLPVPTPGPEQAIRIRIPAIHVDAPVVQGDGWEQLKKGVGQALGTGNPGRPGNVVLSAHNDIFGEIFRDLDQLKPGDEIILYTASREYVYTVAHSEVVEPTRVEVMAPTTDATVTLISCYPYLVDTQRIVVVGKLQTP